VIDEQDVGEAGDIEALGMHTVALDTIMRTPEVAERLARAALDLAYGRP
jgi:hypothetical protein